MLQGLFNLAFGKQSNVEEDLEQLKAMQKAIRDDAFTPEDEYLRKIVNLTYLYKNEPEHAFICCNIISILALDENHATFLLNSEIFRCLNGLLALHSTNRRVLYKICAAIWNLLRVDTASPKVPNGCFSRLWGTLNRHNRHARVVYTALGALSNLALISPNSMSMLLNERNLKRLKQIVGYHMTDSDICNHFGVFVANLSVNWNAAERCLDAGYLNVLIDILRSKHRKVSEVTQHVLAAIYNISDAIGFATKLCLAEGIEVFQTILEESNTPEVIQCIQGIYSQASIDDSVATSLHLAVRNCKLEITLSLILESDVEIEAVDRCGYTACDLAIQQGRAKLVEVLVASGSKISDDALLNVQPDAKIRIARAVKRGKRHRAKSQCKIGSILTENTSLVQDVSGLIIGDFLSGAEILVMANS